MQLFCRFFLSAETMVTVKEISRVSLKSGKGLSKPNSGGIDLDKEEVVVRFRYGDNPERQSTRLQE